jgi:hypothetical protein
MPQTTKQINQFELLQSYNDNNTNYVIVKWTDMEECDIDSNSLDICCAN